MSKNVFLTLHGHFYQPPRENPWLEEIETQESAAPYHDWNERIYQECYQSNAKARVLDAKGLVVDIVNNFEKINFNFGPTLMSWLEAKHPETYQMILGADRKSLAEHDGHGNAIAQVYNHMIMPLANRRDKITQVRWGIEDFRKRFGREPEAIWLPETACDEETLEVLVDAGMKYLILAPHQAEAVVPIGGGQWQDVSAGTIDPKQPYRCFLKKYPEKFIDIFFYDGPISKDAGFGDLLFDAMRFMDRLESAKAKEAAHSQLIHLAVDGETYGHHKAFGDRVLAYLFYVEAPRRGVQVTNYGVFLAKNPPRFQVRLKEGENGEGTSWSCAHGVKRWKENCGCRTGGPVEWNQNWRKPLRQTFDWLRNELAALYEEQARPFLKDAWEARNDYISVILYRSPENIDPFFARHGTRPLSQEEKVRTLKLLEIQRHAMLMDTSCGWFFNELSGIETVQVIEYAAHAVELAREVTGRSLEEEFLRRLSEAKSNLPEFKDGRGVYEKLIVPHRILPPHIASFYAISSLVDDYYADQSEGKFYCYKIRVFHERKESFGGVLLSFGHVRISSQITLEEHDLVFAAIHTGLYDFRCSVKPFASFEELERMEKELFDALPSTHLVEFFRKMDDLFGKDYYALKDLPRHQRAKIISILTGGIIEKISTAYENLYDENRRMSEIYRTIHLPIPQELRYAAEHTLSRRLESTVLELAANGFNPKKAAPLNRIIDNARHFGVELKKENVARFLSLELERRTKTLLESIRPEVIQECLHIQKMARKIGLEMDMGRSQEQLFLLLKGWVEAGRIPEVALEASPAILQLLGDLHIHPEGFKKLVQKQTSHPSQSHARESEYPQADSRFSSTKDGGPDTISGGRGDDSQ